MSETKSPVPDKVEIDEVINLLESFFYNIRPHINRHHTAMGKYFTALCKIKSWQAQQSDAVEDVLAKAVSVIKQWHNADEVWELYYLNAPEMKPIRDYYQSKQ